jgi:adenylate kinase
MAAVKAKKIHLILGAPGSGKGSQARLLFEKFSLTHVSTGDILRDSVAKGTEAGLRARGAMVAGGLVDDDIVNGIILERLRDESGDVLFDGYPRNLNQATALDGFIADRGLCFGIVAYIDMPERALEERILGRRLCSNGACAATYHMTRMRPRVEGICDACGSPLVTRPDDSLDSFRVRMAEFMVTYVPMLDHYRGNPNFRQIDGLALPEEVFQVAREYYEEHL